MRLVLVAQDFPPTIGGIQTYAIELGRRLAPRCQAFSVVAPAHDSARAFDRELPFAVHRVAGPHDLFFAAAALRMRTLAPQISLHTQWPSAFGALIARGRSRRARVCVAAHGRELLLQPFAALPGARDAYDAARQTAFRHADRVFAVSRYTAELVRAVSPVHGPLHVIGNGTDPQRFRPLDASALRDELGLRDELVFLSVARLVARKGIDQVVRALASLGGSRPAPSLVIVGDGPERAALVALVRSLGLEQRVRFAGSVPAAALPHWYNLADAFVLPARNAPPDVEGFGIVYLEASACGKPVIGARGCGAEDAILHGETGLLVDPEQPAQLAAAMRELASDRARACELGRNGRLHVERRANWDAVADQYYAQLAAACA